MIGAACARGGWLADLVVTGGDWGWGRERWARVRGEHEFPSCDGDAGVVSLRGLCGRRNAPDVFPRLV